MKISRSLYVFPYLRVHYYINYLTTSGLGIGGSDSGYLWTGTVVLVIPLTFTHRLRMRKQCLQDVERQPLLGM